MPLCSLEEAIADLQAGKFVILVDDANRENEGDLVMPAEMVTPQAVNFMVTHARGLLCMPMMEERLDELDIPMVDSINAESDMPTAFTVSLDYKVGTTTGICAFYQAQTHPCLLYTSPSPRDRQKSRMPSSA